MSTINPLSSSYVQSVLGKAIQDDGLTTNTSANNPNSIDPSSISQLSDNGGLSPFAQVVSTLQQLQQSDPAKYQQVTQQIAANLQSAAQTALTNGNTTAANQLNQLATDFTNASKSGQLPNIQDLAKAVGGHHHHHHPHAAPADPDSSTTSASSSLLSNNPTDALNPTAIILNTLSQAGINVSNG